MRLIFKAFLVVLPILISSCSDGNDKRSRRHKRNRTEIKSASNSHKNVVIENVSAQKFKELMDSEDGIILDVRTPGETARGAIKGASFINVYDKQFAQKVNMMQKDKPIYLYCLSGSRSVHAAKVLASSKFKKVYNLTGGLNSWRRAGYKLTKPIAGADKNVKQLSLNEFGKMLSTDLPVLVDFHTEWCSPCRKMAPIVDDLDKENEGKVEVLRIDVDKSREVAKHYGIQGVPVFIIYKDGKEVWRHSGTIEKEALQLEMNKALKI